MKVKIYKYRYKGDIVFAQGQDEKEVRFVLETKLNLPHGTLQEGSDNLSMKQIERAVKGNQILVKTHKFYKKKVALHRFLDNKGVTRTKYRNKIIKITKLSDEYRRLIKRLLTLDYAFLIEQQKVDRKLQNAENRIRNINKTLRKNRDIAYAKRQSLENSKEKLKEDVDVLKEMSKAQTKRSWNTGYYVAESYPHKNYEEVIEAFTDLYRKIRGKLLNNSLQDLPYDPENPEVTLLEKLDNFMLYEKT